MPLHLTFTLLNSVFIIFVIIIIVIFIKENLDYKKCAYYQITKTPYFLIRYDTGKYGEYLTYKKLKNFEDNGAKFLFNVYIPKENGETTEIDVLMISSKGLFVFESKNYSGWIFGSETQKKWCQTLPAGRGRSHKKYFYNPIMQNRLHIKHLKAFLGEQIPMRSVIVFSERCTLKDIRLKSNDVNVINRYSVYDVVFDIFKQTENDILTEFDIAEIYNKLYSYTQVDEKSKSQHIESIKNKLNNKSEQQFNETLTQENSQVEPEKELVEKKDIGVTAINTYDETPILDSIELDNIDKKENQVLKCPICNSVLVLRTATKGANSGKQFYGCSNYPKCKFIRNI